MARLISVVWIASLAVAVAVPASAQSARPSTQPSTPALELHEWAVFVLDSTDNELNTDGVVQSALPPFVDSRRQTSANSQDRPSPIGIMRFTGASDVKVDVKLEKVAGTFLSSWPKAHTRSNQLLWQDLTIGTDPGGRPPEKVAAGNWFDRLRQTDSSYMKDENSTDRFLLYDIEMPYNCELNAKSSGTSDGAVELNNTGKVTLHNLMLYRTDHGKLLAASVGNLPAKVSTSTQPPTTPPAKTTPATMPTTSPIAQRIAHLTAAPTTQPIELAGKWKQTLTAAGMSSADADLAIDVVAQYAIKAHSLAGVYLMDNAEFDRLLPLEVVPEPQKITRIGLVIIRNLDPTASNEIDDLITQLGDPLWSKRQEAYEALKSLGSTARTRLQAATKNKDVEIVWRAERLLAAKNSQQ